MLRPSLVALALLLPAAALEARCVPLKLLRIVTVFEPANAPPDAFARKPKTLYRLGEKYGRMEEELDEERNLHGLIVVNEPNVWMVNLADRTGKHIVDTGESVVFHAPLVDKAQSKLWSQFEFGCEVEFMKAVGAEAESLPDGGTRYVHAAEGVTATLTVKADGKPARVEIKTAEEPYAIRYVAFETVDKPPASLFTRPQGIRFTEGTD